MLGGSAGGGWDSRALSAECWKLVEWGPVPDVKANNIRTLNALAVTSFAFAVWAAGFQHLLLAVLTNQFNSGPGVNARVM